MTANGPARVDRVRGALWGQFLGDALCLGSHWLYNLRERQRRFPDGINGFEPPAADHYHRGRHPGDGTHYADAATELLVAVAEHGAGLKDGGAEAYGQGLVKRCGDPAYSGFLDKPTRILLEREREWRRASPDVPYPYNDGADDEQTVTQARLAPLIALAATAPDRDQIVERWVRVCQNNDRSVAHAQVYATLLADCLDGVPLAAAIDRAVAAAPAPFDREIAERLEDAKAMLDLPAIHATGEVGRSCYLPNTFPSILHVLLKHGDDVETALLESVRAGGDNASRTAVVGAVLGAVHGLEGLPTDWLERLRSKQALAPLIDEVAERSA